MIEAFEIGSQAPYLKSKRQIAERAVWWRRSWPAHGGQTPPLAQAAACVPGPFSALR